MSSDQLVRLLIGLFGMIFVLGALGEMWYGPARGMTWAQFCRYAAVVIIVGGTVVFEYLHRNVTVTNYTINALAGVGVGALGVLPFLKKPMRRLPGSSSADSSASTETPAARPR